MTEWYKKEIDHSSPPSSSPPSLFHLSLRSIHDHFSSIVPPLSFPLSPSSSSLSSLSLSPLSILPTGLLQTVLNFMMKARRQGSRSLNENTVYSFFLPSLVSLDLEGFWVTHAPFVLYNCPYLTFLNLKNCLPIQDAAIQKICAVSTNIEVMILKNLHHLTKLSTQAIGGSTSNENENERMENDKTERITYGCKNLQVLALSCKSLTEVDLLPIINNCTKLRILKLQRAKNVKAKILVEYLQKLKSLEVLVLSGCEFTDQDFQQVLSLPHLKYLKIENCSSLSGQQITRISTTSTVTRLKFVECNKLDNIANILHYCTNLTALAITSCKKVTDSTIQGLLEFSDILNKIESFTIQHNTKVTDASIKPLLWRFGTQLKEVDLSSCTKVSKIFQNTTPTGHEIVFPSLECMVLDGCKSIDYFPDQCMFPNILHLNISGVTIRDATLISILTPLKHLHTLLIKCCHGLTGSFCLIMAQNNLVPNLLHMELANCAGIRDEVKMLGVKYPLKIASNSLHFLDISGLKISSIQIDCPNLEIIDLSFTVIEPGVIAQIISGVPRLTSFWAKRNLVTPDLLRNLATTCPQLQVMDITNCDRVQPSSLVDIIPLFKNVYPIFRKDQKNNNAT